MANPIEPPCDVEAEMSLLGAMLLGGGRVVSGALDLLRSEEFYRDAHRAIFVTMGEIVMEGAQVDIVSLRDSLSRKGLLDSVGGLSYLMRLGDIVPSPANYPTYAQIIRERFRRRRVVEIAYKAISLAGEQSADTEEIIDLLGSDFSQMAVGYAGKGDEGSESLVRETLNSLGQKRDPTPFGIPSLDRMLFGGVNRGDMCVIGARPSRGKTAIILQVIAQMIARGLGAVFLSLEMTRVEIGKRLISHISGVGNAVLSSGAVRPGDKEKMIAAARLIKASGLVVLDQERIGTDTSARHLVRLARYYTGSRGARAVFLDYLQIVSPDPTRPVSDIRHVVGEASRALCSLGKQAGVPVFVCSQLRRAATEDGEDRRPTMDHLRETGDIEAAADSILLLHRTTRKGTRADTLLILDKQRNGPTGEVGVIFKMDTGEFREMSEAQRKALVLSGGRKNEEGEYPSS